MTDTEQQDNQSWLFRFVKGMFIGSGFIIPGVSGGALAAIFGIYERLIKFIANITDNFMKNLKFFLPVGLGAFFGIFLLSFVVSFALENYATISIWFFVGAIVGMIPSLWKEAEKQGRDKVDWTILIVAFVFGIVLLGFGNQLFDGQVQPSFWSFLICGVLIALGVLVPGLSPSNFIVYMGLYGEMSNGFKNLDLTVLVPIALGGIITIFSLAKLIEKIFDNYYSQFYHFIFGVVLASTVMIIPTDYQGFGFVQYLWCVIMLGLGTAIGAWMSKLEEQYK